jgi:hypothetical protein
MSESQREGRRANQMSFKGSVLYRSQVVNSKHSLLPSSYLLTREEDGQVVVMASCISLTDCRLFSYFLAVNISVSKMST